MVKRFMVAVFLQLSLCAAAFAGGPVLSPDFVPELPRSEPFSWEGPYVGGHVGKVWGTQRDDQSEVVDPV